MNPVKRALWFVESHMRGPTSLKDIADSCHVSPYHLARAFSETTGSSLMRYVRARRLTKAARRLAEGADDILDLALDSGYGSHEAFTRAFRELFSLTPEQVRAQGNLNNLNLTEAIVMQETASPKLIEPRFETIPSKRIAGLRGRFPCAMPSGIPALWEKFVPHLGRIPGQIGGVAYGVCDNFDEDGNFDYLSGVEVTGEAALPRGFETVVIPSRKYAVFTHTGHISGIRSTIQAIWGVWFPQNGKEAAESPSFERYGEDFNGQTGMGNVEIWVPLKE